jgi:hypothetical protein
VIFTSCVDRIDRGAWSVTAWTAPFIAGKNTKTKPAVSFLPQDNPPLHFDRKYFNTIYSTEVLLYQLLSINIAITELFLHQPAQTIAVFLENLGLQ